MGITRKEIKGFGMPATTMLARIATGRGLADLIEDQEPATQVVTLRLPVELVSWMSDLASKCRSTRNAVAEILLYAGREEVESQIEIDGQMEMPLVTDPPKATRKAAKK